MKRLRPMLCSLLLMLAVGCDSGPQMANVKGTITFGGNPVKEGAIQFFPNQPGPMAAGRLAADGSFELSTKAAGDGAIVGEYIVVVVPPSDVNRLQAELKEGQPWKATFDDIPASVRTQQTSPLFVEVVPGKNEFTFDLKELPSTN